MLEIVSRTGALDATRELAEREANLAIDQLGAIADSKYKSALEIIARSSVARKS